MALFRDVQGRFFEIPEEILKDYEVKKEAMDQEFGKKNVVGVQVPRPETQFCGPDMGVAQQPGIVVYQFFGQQGPMVKPSDVLPSDIELAHYGTTIDNPKE